MTCNRGDRRLAIGGKAKQKQKCEGVQGLSLSVNMLCANGCSCDTGELTDGSSVPAVLHPVGQVEEDQAEQEQCLLDGKDFFALEGIVAVRLLLELFDLVPE